MRGCHDPAGVRAVGRRETRIEVLLSERNPEPERHNRTRALPFCGLVTPVALRNATRLNSERIHWAAPVRLEAQRAKARPGPPLEPCVDPLYLFACGISWRKQSNTDAGWELVRYVRSSGQAAQIAAALLAQGEIPPLRSRVRAIGRPGKASLENAAGVPISARWQP